jgi:hypothetical protein
MMHQARVKWPDVFLAVGCGAAALLLYVKTLAPTVSVEDTGELIAAAYCLGIPHPTGYPLWTLLAHGFIHYLPFGGEVDPIAWRANFMSALFGAGTVALVAWLLVRVTGRRMPALAASLALGGSREVWQQSVIAEVYTLNSFLLTLSIVLVWQWRETRRPALLYALALTLGLGMCNHSTMVLVALVLVSFVVLVEGFSATAWKRYAVMALLIVVALGLQLYLPLRARANPPMNWGNPSDWQGFLDVVTRVQYHGLIAEHPRTLGRFLAQSRAFLSSAIWEFGPWVGWLAPVGAVLLTRRKRWLGALLITLFAVAFASALLVPNFDLDRQGRWHNTTFFIPLYVIAAIWIGESIAALAGTRHGRAAAFALALVTALSPVVLNYRVNDMSAYLVSRDYAFDLFDSMQPNAVYFGVGDHRLFPLRYLQIAHDVRTDVLIANPYGYVPEHVYADMPRAERTTFQTLPTTAEENRILRWFLDGTDRPVYSAEGRDVAGTRVEAQGLVHRYYRLDARAPHSAEAPVYRGSAQAALAVPDDWTAEQIAFDYLSVEGRTLLAAGETEAALARWRSAARVAHGDESMLTNLAAEAGSSGQFRFAEEILTQLREEKPRHLPARLNLVRLYVLAGRHRPAADELHSLQREFPESLRVARMVTWARGNGVPVKWSRAEDESPE